MIHEGYSEDDGAGMLSLIGITNTIGMVCVLSLYILLTNVVWFLSFFNMKGAWVLCLKDMVQSALLVIYCLWSFY